MAVYTVSLRDTSNLGDVSVGDGTLLAELSVSAGRGPKGDGFTGGTYNASTGVVTFTSNDGIGFSTGDLRGDLSEPGPIGDVTPGTGSFTDVDLSAIAASKAVTAVDVFVYDTSKDSDGGAWRKRTQHTSWYNETLNTATRGSRREFPAVAVIVAEAYTVTIYDGDDPDMPMWMVFNKQGNYKGSWIGRTGTPVTSVAILNGEMVVTCNSNVAAYAEDCTQINFIKDSGFYHVMGYKYLFNSDISNRNTAFTTTAIASDGIVAYQINDVAMTVLPDAPIDPATGLPVPTIAVATAGGVSVIKDDGTVVDITASSYTLYTSSVQFDGHDLVFQADGNSNVGVRRITYVEAIPEADFVLTGFDYNRGNADERYIPVVGGAWTGDLFFALGSSTSNQALPFNGSIATEGSSGLNLLSRRPDDPTKGMIAGISSTYNTGWMNGDIKGAFLADTDDTDLVGSGELVTNGTFDTDTSGWTFEGTATNTSAAGYLEGITGAASNVLVSSPITTVIGQTYVVTGNFVSGNSVGAIVAGSSMFAQSLGSSGYKTAGSFWMFAFRATTTTTYISVLAGDANKTVRADNISVKLADADRSVNKNGLIVNGTVTRSPVATGAELVAYSGFSSSNYLEQPYNSDLDFGTGDFCVMGWVKWLGSVSSVVFDRANGTDNTNRINMYIQSSGILHMIINGTDVSNSGVVSASTWSHVCFRRTGGVLYAYINGTQVNSVASTSSVTGSFVSRTGLNVSGSTPFNGSLALLRISATAPTAEAIKKIYEDEKVLFQENAACALYGTSDSVTALAHDSDTGLLHVGTSAGRSVFQGLRRVSNTTTAVGTAISASNGLVVEE